MLEVNGLLVEVQKVEALDVVAADDNQKIETRVRFAVQDLNGILGELPIHDAVAAAIKDGKAVEGDGPNTITLRVRRRFALMEYTLKDGDSIIAQYEARVVLQPTIKVVEGMPVLIWTVQGTISPDELAQLARHINSDDVTLTTVEPDGIQPELFT